MPSGQPRRERIVLSERRGARPVRTRVEVAEQSRVGEHLVRGLVRAQLGLALRIGLSVLLQLAVVYVPWLNTAFGTVPLGLEEWLVALVLASSVLWLDELRKIVFRARQRSRDGAPGAANRSAVH